MKNKRGLSTGMKWFWGIVGVLVIIGLIWGSFTLGGGSALSITPIIAVTDNVFDGEFDDSDVPENVAGTALRVYVAYAEANEAFTASYNSTTNVNVTAGLPYQFAFNFEINENMKNLDIDGALSATVLPAEMIITKAYILRDEEGVSMASNDAIATGIVDSDNDDFEIKMDAILDGEYVLVVEAKTIAPSTIGNGELLFTVDFDADSTDNDAVDEGLVSVYNL